MFLSTAGTNEIGRFGTVLSFRNTVIFLEEEGRFTSEINHCARHIKRKLLSITACSMTYWPIQCHTGAPKTGSKREFNNWNIECCRIIVNIWPVCPQRDYPCRVSGQVHCCGGTILPGEWKKIACGKSRALFIRKFTWLKSNEIKILKQFVILTHPSIAMRSSVSWLSRVERALSIQ